MTSGRPAAPVITPGTPSAAERLIRPASYGALVLLVTFLAAIGWLPRWPGLLHLVALPPLDLAADLRLLLARAPSFPAFVLLLSLVVAVRVTVLAVLLGGRHRPRWRWALGIYGVATVPLLLAGQLTFIAYAGLYSRLFGAAVAVVAVVFVVLAAAVWVEEDRLGSAIRRALGAGFRAGELAVYVTLLLILGGVAQVAGPVASVVFIPASGALTFLTIRRLRQDPPAHARGHLAAVAALVLAAAALTVVTRGSATAGASPRAHDGSVLVMSGINSASGEGAVFELDPASIGFDCTAFHYFSYAGTGPGQPQGDAACPKRSGAPYEPRDTQRPFAEQVALLIEQVEPLEPPVTILAHSQAAWVAWHAATQGRLAEPTRLVLIGPFPSSPLAFPPPGRTGSGRVGGELFRWFEPVPRLVDFDFDVDAPLTRELLATPNVASDVFDQPLPPEVDALALTATTDLALMPGGWRLEHATNACPIREAHPHLPHSPDLRQAIDDFLAGEHQEPTCPRWPELYRVTSQALGPPPHDA